MFFEEPKLAEAKTVAPSKVRWNVVWNDLYFLAYVTLAHFIVWRTLRCRDRENSARRRQFKLLRGEGPLTQAQPQLVRAFVSQTNAVANRHLVLRQTERQGG
jgi:hypothetical protein